MSPAQADEDAGPRGLGWAWMSAGLLLACAGGEAGPDTVQAPGVDVLEPEDAGAVASADIGAGRVAPDADPRPVDVGAQGDLGAAPDPCGGAALATSFSENVRPWVGGCRPCHDMTLPAGALKAPGPQWYHSTDDQAVVDALFELGLIDPVSPLQSPFLLKPLSLEHGGEKHPGGSWLEPGTPEHGGFVEFLELAAECAP